MSVTTPPKAEASFYAETVTEHTGQTTAGTCSDTAARSLLTRARRGGYDIELDRSGVLTVRRRVHRGCHTVTLRPGCSPRTTPRQHQDLAAIAARPGSSFRRNGCIHAGLYRIPPAAATRLVHRGWVTIAGDETASLTLAGLVALSLTQHTTRTTVPRGWYYPAEHPERPYIDAGGTNGKHHHRACNAVCSCGWVAPCGDRRHAVRAAHAHRARHLAVLNQG